MTVDPGGGPVADLDDDELVRLTGLQRMATNHQDSAWGFQAAAELTRRLTIELRETRLQAASSSETLERYTRWLVRLTWALLAIGVVTIIATLAN